MNFLNLGKTLYQHLLNFPFIETSLGEKVSIDRNAMPVEQTQCCATNQSERIEFLLVTNPPNECQETGRDRPEV